MPKVDPETLKNGKVLEYLIQQFVEQPAIENLSPIFACLLDTPYLYVPMNLTMSEADAATFANAKVGDTITSTDNIRMKPDWLQHTSGKLFLPIFTNTDKAPEDYRSKFSWINLTIDACLDLLNKNPDASGLIFNAFTASFAIQDEFLDALKKVVAENRNHNQ